jgi:hypothetical protein
MIATPPVAHTSIACYSSLHDSPPRDSSPHACPHVWRQCALRRSDSRASDAVDPMFDRPRAKRSQRSVARRNIAPAGVVTLEWEREILPEKSMTFQNHISARRGLRSTVRSVAALASGLRSKLMVLGETTLAGADALAAFTTRLSGETRVLRKAALLVWHTFATFAGNRALLFRVHRCETAGRCLVVGFSGTGHSSSLIGASRLNASS